MKSLRIGQAAEATGLKVPTIRFYESIGLLGAPDRTASNRRLYDGPSLDRLRFIRHARELGFQLDAIRALLALQEDGSHSCAEADTIARAHLLEVDRRIKSLTALKAELERMIRTCKRGRIAQCRVIDVLANHAHCINAHHD